MNTAFWGFTINNYTATDLALVQQGYPDHIRQIVYTLETGEEGTPHIQGYLKLYRQQRLSYVRKLFPRANFTAITSDHYKLNAQRYAQKLDETADSPAVITNNPFPDPIVELVSVLEEAFRRPDMNVYYHDKPESWEAGQPPMATLLQWLTDVEFDRVRRTPRLVKFYVSPMYRNVKKEYINPIKAHVFDLQKSEAHTHTHTQHVAFEPAEELSQHVDIPTQDEDEDLQPQTFSEEDEDEDEDSQACTDDEEGSDCSSEEDSEL